MSGLPNDLQLNLVERTADARDFIDWLHQPRRIMGLDTETEGLDSENDRIRLIQFGDMHTGWAMGWEDWRGLATEAIDTWKGEWAFHNSKFDIRAIQKARGRSVTQWPWHLTHDTMGMAHILDSQRPKALKALSDMHIDGRASAGQKALDEGMAANGWDWPTVPISFPPYWQYGALDPVLNCYLFDKFEPAILEHRDLYDIEMGAIRVAARMEELGLRIDLDYASSKAAELDAYAITLRKWLKDVYGLDTPTTQGLIKFFNEQGVPLLEKFTKGGAQSMDKHVLQTTDHEVARQVLQLRRAEKVSGTYLHNFERFSNSEGFMHPNIITMAARTGRMSITKPALQTLPRKDPIVRDAIIPRDEHSFLTIDADQIEARLTAHFSRDPGLIAAFNRPEDFFEVIATQLFGYPVHKGMQERDLVKGVVYGKVYGASVDKMAETAGVTFLQMGRTNALFDTNFPAVRKLMKDVIDVGKSRKAMEGRGYVVTPYGRRLNADSGMEYALVNYLIQCHASEILKKKMVMLDAALPSEALMLLPVHDEIIFDIPTEMMPEVKRDAELILNEAADYAVPMTWGGDVLEHAWGDKYGGRFTKAAA